MMVWVSVESKEGWKVYAYEEEYAEDGSMVVARDLLEEQAKQLAKVHNQQIREAVEEEAAFWRPSGIPGPESSQIECKD